MFSRVFLPPYDVQYYEPTDIMTTLRYYDDKKKNLFSWHFIIVIRSLKLPAGRMNPRLLGGEKMTTPNHLHYNHGYFFVCTMFKSKYERTELNLLSFSLRDMTIIVIFVGIALPLGSLKLQVGEENLQFFN